MLRYLTAELFEAIKLESRKQLVRWLRCSRHLGLVMHYEVLTYLGHGVPRPSTDRVEGIEDSCCAPNRRAYYTVQTGAIYAYFGNLA